jgi:DNA primase
MAQYAGINPKRVAGTEGGEYHSACPICSGTDRFYIQPNRQMNKCQGYYCCRKCGISGDTIQFARQFLNYSFQEATQLIGANTEKRIFPCSARVYTYRPIMLQPPSKEWIMCASDFVDQAHKQLLHKSDVLEYLTHRGLPLASVELYKLGWSDKDLFLPRISWGLPELLENRPLWIPKGLVIPTMEHDGKVVRLKVRRYNWHEGDKLPKYVAISGSMNGLSIISTSKQAKTVVVVESELDAYAVDFVAHDFACTIAVGSNIKNPDNVTDRLARKAQHLLICHDNDEAGTKMLNKWQRLYPHATNYPTPVGKDVGEAIQKGFNLREWLLHAMDI